MFFLKLKDDLTIIPIMELDLVELCLLTKFTVSCLSLAMN